MISKLRARLERFEVAAARWAEGHGVELMRITLGLLFVWFGVLKLCPGLSDVEMLAARTMQVFTLGLVPVKVCIWMLGTVETGVGVSLISGVGVRVAVLCVMAYLAAMFLPLAIFPAETWKHFPYAPTPAGADILKNVVLLAAAVMVAGRAYAVKAPVLQMVPVRRRLARVRRIS